GTAMISIIDGSSPSSTMSSAPGPRRPAWPRTTSGSRSTESVRETRPVITPNRTGIDVNQVIDAGRWGAYQRWLVLLTAVAVVFDGMDNQLLGVAIPSIMRTWGVDRGAFAPVVSLGYLGMAIGGGLAGLAGDRLGRRTALVGSMFVFGTATI